MDGSSKGRGAARGISILVVGFLAAGAFVVGPASAGKFLTKKAGDRRYYNVGETVANADKLDGIDSAAFLQTNRVRWGAVNADGSLARASGVTSATRASQGIYIVLFDRDVSGCGILTSSRGGAGTGIQIIHAFDPTGPTVRVETAAKEVDDYQDARFTIAALC